MNSRTKDAKKEDLRSKEERCVLEVYAAQLRSVAAELEDEACDIILRFMDIASALDVIDGEGMTARDEFASIRTSIDAVIERLQMFDGSAQRVGHIADSAERLVSLGGIHGELEALTRSYSCAVEHEIHNRVCDGTISVPDS